jgi:hypothetical protein
LLAGRACVANARRHFERAELHGLTHLDLKMRDAARHFVKRGEDGDLILDLLGLRRPSQGHGKGCGHHGRQTDAPAPGMPDPCLRILRHIAYPIAATGIRHRATPSSSKRVLEYWGNDVARRLGPQDAVRLCIAFGAESQPHMVCRPPAFGVAKGRA